VELQSALRDRVNVEKLWHQAERERDREVAGKADLYQRIGALEGDVGAAKRETQEARRETDAARQQVAAKEGDSPTSSRRARAAVGAAGGRARPRARAPRPGADLGSIHAGRTARRRTWSRR
jgi:hypothetical protein